MSVSISTFSYSLLVITIEVLCMAVVKTWHCCVCHSAFQFSNFSIICWSVTSWEGSKCRNHATKIITFVRSKLVPEDFSAIDIKAKHPLTVTAHPTDSSLTAEITIALIRNKMPVLLVLMYYSYWCANNTLNTSLLVSFMRMAWILDVLSWSSTGWSSSSCRNSTHDGVINIILCVFVGFCKSHCLTLALMLPLLSSPCCRLLVLDILRRRFEALLNDL